MSSTGKSNALSSSTAAVACNRRRAAPPNRHKSHFNNHFRAHADTHAYKLWHICVCVGQLTSAQYAKKPVISSTKPEKKPKIWRMPGVMCGFCGFVFVLPTIMAHTYQFSAHIYKHATFSICISVCVFVALKLQYFRICSWQGWQVPQCNQTNFPMHLLSFLFYLLWISEWHWIVFISH